MLIHAPLARVWSALTEARYLGRWFGDAAERRRHLEANEAGWNAELEELRGYLTPLPA